MSNKIIEIVDQLNILKINEVLELIKQIEISFGVSNSSITNLTQNNIKITKEQIIEKVEFTLMLDEVPADKKISVLKVIRTLTNLGLREVKELVESTPKIVKENLPIDKAELFKKQIEEAGGKASLK